MKSTCSLIVLEMYIQSPGGAMVAEASATLRQPTEPEMLLQRRVNGRENTANVGRRAVISSQGPALNAE